MTVRDLIAALEYADLDDEVRVAYHPSYPLRGTVASVVNPMTLVDAIMAADGVTEDEAIDQVEAGVTWIAVGSAPRDESPYAPREAWQR